MRHALIAAALLSTAAIAAAQTSPVAAPYTAPTDQWNVKAHALYEHASNTPTVASVINSDDPP